MVLKTSEVFRSATATFVQDLVHQISAKTGKQHEITWLKQLLFLEIVFSNAASVLTIAPYPSAEDIYNWSISCAATATFVQGQTDTST